MIEAITHEQESLLPVYRDKWTRIGLSTIESTNQEEAELGVKLAYEEAGLKPPSKVVWCEGPLAGSEETKKVTTNQVSDQVRNRVWNHVLNRVWNRVWNQVSDQVQNQVQNQVRNQGDQVWNQVWNQVRNQVWNQVSDQVWSQVWNQVIWGQLDSGYYALCDFMANVLGIEEAKKLGGLSLVSKNCSFWWAFEDTAILARKPELLKLEEGRLHSATGPAFRFHDSFEGYYWKGTEVPSNWILNPKAIDPQWALNWERVEQRRCAAEIVGWKKVLELLKPRIVDSNQDPVVGTLVEVSLEGRAERFLQVLCGTGRTFCIPVPREVKTAQEAQNWIWQWDPELPKPEVRT